MKEQDYKIVYRIYQYGESDLCSVLAMLAAKSNAGNYVTLSQMAGWADCEKHRYPSLYSKTFVDIFTNGQGKATSLHINNNKVLVMSIEETKVFEPVLDNIDETGEEIQGNAAGII